MSSPDTLKVLFVDDDEHALVGYRRSMRKRYALDTALGGEEALALMAAQGPYAVLVADMRMPGMDGIELLKRAQALAPDTVRVMLTGNADQRTAQDAVNQGRVFRFLTKPCTPEDLAGALDAALRQYELASAEKQLLERTLSGCVALLTEVLGVQDGPLFGRSGPTAELAHALALDLGAEDAWQVRVAALLAPLGLVTVPPALLARLEDGGAPTEAERAVLSRFPETSAAILGYIPRMERVAEIVLYQQKDYDGGGFPDDGAAGEDLPLGARILRAAAEFTALEAAYGSAGDALDEMRQRPGAFDPHVLAALARRTEGRGAPAGTRPAALSELRPGDLLAAPALGPDGGTVMAAGTRLSAAHLEKLANHAHLGGLGEPLLVVPGPTPPAVPG